MNDDTSLKSKETASEDGQGSKESTQAKALSGAELSSAEATTASAQETEGFYHPNAKDKIKNGSLKHFLWGSSKRKVASSATISVVLIVGILVGLLFVAAGPAQLEQLSAILQKPFGGQNNTLSNRFNSELSHFQGAPSDISATRLGYLGQLYLKPLYSKLTGAGITFNENGVGHLESVTIDEATLATHNSDFDALTSTDERTDWLASNFGNLDPSTIKYAKATGTFSISAASWGDTQIPTAVAKGVLGGSAKIAIGDVIGAIATRVLLKKYDVATLFHPLRKVTNAAEEKAVSAQAQATDEQDSEVDDAITEPLDEGFGVSDLTSGLKGDLSDFDESSPESVATGALLVQGAYCEAYSSVGDVIHFDRIAIVVPAAIEAVRLISVGDQIKAGDDVSSQEVGNVTESLTNSKGQSIWGATSLMALENSPENGGTDLSSDYAQAFSSSTTADTLEAALGSYGISKIACSAPAKIISAAIGIGLLIGSAGSSSIAVLALKVGVGAAVTGGAMLAIRDIIETTLKDNAAVPEALSGPLGGNLAAYGAREASNITSITEGGTPLSNTDSQQVVATSAQQSEKQFASESLFDRIFDIDDYRSILGKIADYISPRPTSDIAKMASDITNIGQLLTHGFMGLLPKVSADNSYTYDWGFSQYGTPSNLLNSSDPTLENPYENASDVVPLLQADQVLPGNTQGVIERAETCFGDTISDSSGTWDVNPTPNFDVNPSGYDYMGTTQGPAYSSGNCSDTSLDWQRVQLFITDTMAMKSGVCYMGDAQSCSDIGIQ